MQKFRFRLYRQEGYVRPKLLEVNHLQGDMHRILDYLQTWYKILVLVDRQKDGTLFMSITLIGKEISSRTNDLIQKLFGRYGLGLIIDRLSI